MSFRLQPLLHLVAKCGVKQCNQAGNDTDVNTKPDIGARDFERDTNENPKRIEKRKKRGTTQNKPHQSFGGALNDNGTTQHRGHQ